MAGLPEAGSGYKLPNRKLLLSTIVYRFTAEKLSRVSFINTDISRIRFQENVIWGDGENDRFKIFDEKLLERSLYPLFKWTIIKNKKEQKKLREYLVNELGQGWVKNECSLKNIDEDTVALVSNNTKNPHTLEIKRQHYDVVTLRLDNERLLPAFTIKRDEHNLWAYSAIGVRVETVKAIYRNLRENYEYRMRYDEAGQFFIREMELKRKYREVRTEDVYHSAYRIKKNGPLRRNLSLTGIYHNLFNYGESLKRPALTLLLPLFIISVSYFLVKHPPSSFDLNGLIHTANILGRTALDMFQVEMEKPELADNIIRTLSLSIFAALFIPLRRKFERRFRH
jgi:uncharacterized protein YeeX (DUF496 family)